MQRKLAMPINCHPLLQTQATSLSQLVEGRTVAEMPLNGRNVLNLVALVSGTIPQGGAMGTTATALQIIRSANRRIHGDYDESFLDPPSLVRVVFLRPGLVPGGGGAGARASCVEQSASGQEFLSAFRHRAGAGRAGAGRIQCGAREDCSGEARRFVGGGAHMRI
jgi:hypothetical protein